MLDSIHYRPSGRAEATGLALATVVSLAAASALGLANGLLSSLRPDPNPRDNLGWPTLMVFCLVLSVFVTASAGLASQAALTWGRVRNLPLGVGVSGCAACVVWYLTWVVRVHRYGGSATAWPLDWPWRPADVWRAILTTIDAYGGPPEGSWFWVLAGVEALVVLALATLIPVWQLQKPFCERCGVWASERPGALRLSSANEADTRRRLEAGDLAVLEELPLAIPSAEQWLGVDLYECPRCRAFAVITVKAELDAQRAPQRLSLPLRWSVDNLVLDTRQFVALRARAAPRQTTS